MAKFPPDRSWACNGVASPRLAHAAFFDLARRLGVESVEIRNDLKGVALLDGTSAAEVGAAAKARGLRILSINALQRFNLWDDSRAAEAASLVAQAIASGAEALVLCPVNDVNYTPSPTQRREALRKALNGLKPILKAAGIVGLVEPLGFAECSLRTKKKPSTPSKRSAARARSVSSTTRSTTSSPARRNFSRTYRPRPYFRRDRRLGERGDDARSPSRPGRRQRSHRQCRAMRALRAGGYRGAISFEPFAASVHDSATIEADLRASLAYVKGALEQG